MTLESITKNFISREAGESVRVLDGIDLKIPPGKVVTLYGPNGCGKTTILNITASIENPDGGSVSVLGNGHPGVSLGYVFQNYRDMLLPWQSALDNIAFGLRTQGVSRDVARERATAFLDKCKFNFPRDNYPYQLSIGQQQTVALARILIQEPANILLDEPFSALDHKARFRMQDLFESVALTDSTSILFVSHDVDEALYVSDELIILSRLPARVMRRFAVPFARPRKRELLTSAEFADLRREVVASFLQEVDR